MASQDNTEPFPELVNSNTSSSLSPPDNATHTRTSSSNTRQSRGQSLVKQFITSNPPLGMWQVTGEVGSKIPTLPEIHDGSFDEAGWSQEGQMENRGTNPHEIHRRASRRRTDSAPNRPRVAVVHTVATTDLEPHQEIEEGAASVDSDHNRTSGSQDCNVHQQTSINKEAEKAVEIMDIAASTGGPDESGTYPNGYRFPKKHTWSQSIAIGLKAFWKFFITPVGFLITIYALNVVGWGAMIFFVLLEAAPAMCHPSCNDPYSARNIWIEIDAQVLTALFCVTAFGLIPWRFRDFYYLMRWRLRGEWDYHRKLAGIYRSWYRLPNSNLLAENVAPPPVYDKKHPKTEESLPPCSDEELKELEKNPALPLPPTSIPDPPLTGIRAAPTKSWNLDIVIWMYMLNTIIQGALCGIMWGLNRFNRPSWATGFLISIGCVTGIVAGIVVFIEGSKVKKAEGIPVKEYDVAESVEDYHMRKAKEDAKAAKKEHKHDKSEVSRVHRTEKLKGGSWFTRH